MSDVSGQWSSGSISVIGIIKDLVEKILTIKYDVPLYNQGGYKLCWAFCQVMIEDYQTGCNRTNEEATERAIEIAIDRNGKKD